MSVRVIPVTDAYRGGWDRVCGTARVPCVEGVTGSLPKGGGGHGIEFARFPLGVGGALAFNLTGCMERNET